MKEQDEVPSDMVLQRLEIDDVLAVLRCRRLQWFGHVERADGCINSVVEMRVPGGAKRGRPRKT